MEAYCFPGNTVLITDFAPSGGSWLCNESSRSGYVVIVHKYYLFSSSKYCIHKLLDVQTRPLKNSAHAWLKNVRTPAWAC
jgi:hypothetical protein